MQIVSHGQNHGHIEKFDDVKDIEDEILLPIQKVEEILGYRMSMAHLPFLSYDDRVLEVCKNLRLPLLGQGIDGGRDWRK